MRERRDWAAWHQQYEQPGSHLAQRLVVVQEMVRDVLDRAPAGPVRVLSLCAGDGRDVLGVLEDHPRRGDVVGRLVELDPGSAATARSRVASQGAAAAMEVVTGDAGTTDAAAGAVPADLLLLCGIFGNISDTDVERCVRQAPHLCAAGATVLWTRHRQEPDLTPAIRRWFAEEGFDEVAFESGAAGRYGVGRNRLAGDPRPFQPGVRLFTFLR